MALMRGSAVHPGMCSIAGSRLPAKGRPAADLLLQLFLEGSKQLILVVILPSPAAVTRQPLPPPAQRSGNGIA